MISDNQPSSFEPPASVWAGPPGPEDILKSGRVQIERKHFLFEIKEGVRGRSLRIAESSSAGLAILVIPASGLDAFKTLLAEMITAATELPSPFHGQKPTPLHRPQFDEVILTTQFVKIERKSFKFLLLENPRGRFLRLTEKAGERFACLFIPASGLEQFQMLLDNIVGISSEAPVPGSAAPPASPFFEHTLNSEHMRAGEKTFLFKFQENARGRYLRLIEESPGNSPSVMIIPASGLVKFKQLTADMIKISSENPPKIPLQ